MFNWLFRKKLIMRETNLLSLRKKTLDFLYDLACKEYRGTLEAIHTNNPEAYMIHNQNHIMLVNRYMKESAQYKQLESLKG